MNTRTNDSIVTKDSVFSRDNVFTIPNLLSVFRLVLAGAFLWLNQADGISQKKMWMIVIIVASAVSDFLDGRIARKYNMVSELGKIIDPIADKVTQGVLLLCLLRRCSVAGYAFGLFLVKELIVGALGALALSRTRKNDGARMYGKVSTAVFYFIMIVLFLFPGIPEEAANVMIVVCLLFMGVSLIGYIHFYGAILINEEKKKREG